MALTFASKEWLEEYGKVLNKSEAYKKAASTWTYGVVALVIPKNPAVGIEDDTGMWLDLDRGICREAKIVTLAEAQTAPFCITGEYARWKQVIKKELEPVKGMMQGKLKLKGDLPTIVKSVAAARELVNCATQVDTKFPDEG
jgi:putative sterol carrier protein